MVDPGGSEMKSLPEMEHVLYIVPGNTRCRVVHARQDMDEFPSWSARESYAKHPQHWSEVGLVNAQGKVVCMSETIPKKVQEQILNDQPLMGGLVYTYTADWEEYSRG